MTRWGPLLGLVLVSLTLAGEASAAMMQHHDLASLAFVSQAVVRARRAPRRDPQTELRDYRVIEVLHGDGLVPGEVVAVYDAHYVVEPIGGVEPVVDEEVILFLQRGTPPGPRWSITPSGLRLSIARGIHRFEQTSNPGPYGTVPQGEDPEDVRRLPGKRGPLSMESFMVELDQALVVAERARRLLPAAPSPERDEGLLGLVGPPVDHPRMLDPNRTSVFYGDLVTDAILETLARDDLDAFLEACARLTRPLPRLFGSPIHAAALLDRAEDIRVPLHRRVTAMRLATAFTTRRELADRAAIAAFFDDPEPTLRAAAFGLESEVGGDLEAKLRSHWATERDPGVRYAMWNAARRWGLALPSEGPVVAAERQGNEVVVGFAWSGDRPEVSHQLVVDDGRERLRVPLVFAEDTTRWGQHELARAAIPKPLRGRAGRWWLEVTLDSESEARVLALGSSAAFTPSPPRAKIREAPPSRPASLPPGSRGCGCAFAEPASLSGGGMALVLGLGVLGWRRRRPAAWRSRQPVSGFPRRGSP